MVDGSGTVKENSYCTCSRMYSRDFASGLTERTSQRWRAAANDSTVLHLTSPEIQPITPPRTRSDVANHQGPGEARCPQCIVKNKKIVPVLVCGRQEEAVSASKNPIFQKQTIEDLF